MTPAIDTEQPPRRGLAVWLRRWRGEPEGPRTVELRVPNESQTGPARVVGWYLRAARVRFEVMTWN